MNKSNTPKRKMDYQEIKKLIDDMGNSQLDSLTIEFPDGIKISMTKKAEVQVGLQTVLPEEKAIIPTNPAEVPAVQIKEENQLTNVPQQEFIIIKSPMVGTFYTSSSPEKGPFVSVGDKIHKGQVVCIIEAMKLMNEIESEFDGEVVEICVQNEEVVEYGMPLFKLK